MAFKAIFLSLFLACSLHLEAAAEHLVFSGHLDARQLTPARQLLEKAPHGAEIAIEISSSSGDLPALLQFGAYLFSAKKEKQLHYILYINGEALGPAAVLPFLADTLYASQVASWGDIPLGNEDILPTNVLRSRVEGLIPPSAEMFRKLAAAMVDKSLSFENDGIAKQAGETLVLDTFQLSALKLIEHPLNSAEFHTLFPNSPIVPLTAAEQLTAELKKYIRLSPNGLNTIGYIAIDERDSQISQATWLYVKKALEYYQKSKPCCIILKLNTPGGQVFAAQKISDALREIDLKYGIPVIAYIDDWAISAGAMLAYSCRFIFTADNGSIGAAAPVMATSSGELKETSEKVNSAIRTDFGNRARFFGRNSDLAEAMVDKDILLVWRHGEIVRLDSNDQLQLKGSDPDSVISAKGKLLTLDADRMMRYGVANATLTPLNESVSAQEITQGHWPLSKTAFWQEPFFRLIPNATIDAYRMDWKTLFFVFLAGPIISSALFTVMLVALYIEINHPGFGVPGTIALTCFLLLALSSLSLEIAHWLELIFLSIGLLFIALEFLIIPTGGALGIIGGLFFLAGFIGMLLPGAGEATFDWNSSTFNAAGEAAFEKLGWLCGGLLMALSVIWLLGRYFLPHYHRTHRLILVGGEQEASAGYTAAGDISSKLPPIGTYAHTTSALRPSGKVAVGDSSYQAMSDGSFIGEDVEVIVTSIEGTTLIVSERTIS